MSICKKFALIDNKSIKLIIQNERLLELLRYNYTVKDIEYLSAYLQEKNTFNFPSLDNGLFPAASIKSEHEVSGYKYVWVRDNIHIAHSFYVNGQKNKAAKTASSLMAYFRQNVKRFIDIISCKVNPNNPINRPHARFDGRTLGEIKEKWAYAQNDALGYFLWLYCMLVNEELVSPDMEDIRVLTMFPLFFKTIRYWEDEDSGHWEEIRKISASSIGAVVAGLRELTQLFTKRAFWKADVVSSLGIDAADVDHIISKGEATLASILPAECVQPDPKKARRYDAALMFLIYPLAVVDNFTADRIIDGIIENLKGDYGIRRYLGDSYWSPDYKMHFPPEKRTIDFSNNMEMRDAFIREGEEAQWCIFDPILSAIFGIKFQHTGLLQHLELQTKYLNRALGQLTGPDSPFGEFRCSEAYYLENGQYVPNDHTPLLWTQANLWVALKIMADSLRFQQTRSE